MISQLIIELSEKGEPKASKELAIAYLKHQKDEEILNLLGKLYHDDKVFQSTKSILFGGLWPCKPLRHNKICICHGVQ